MTRIDFHFNAPDKLNYVCRLARKVHGAGKKMVVYSSQHEVIQRLDSLLWTFSPLDFLPHCDARDALANTTPIVLLTSQIDTAHHEVLVNIDLEQPAFFSRFERVIEIVTTDADDRHAGRQRWKFYQERGYALSHYDLSHSIAK